MAEVLRIKVRADRVWQDSAGTIPAGVGDPVGRVDDPDRGISVTQDVTGNKPTLLQDGNGHLFLDGDGLDDYLSNATFQPTPGGAQPFTAVAVVRAKGTATTNPLWGHGAGSGDYRQRAGDYQLNFGSNLRQGIPNTNLRVHHTEVNGASSAIYIDNALLSTAGNPTTPGNAGSNAWAAGLYVLSVNGLAQFGNQELYELIIHDGLLDATARTALYDELWDYYSNPAGGGDPEPIDLSASITNAGQSPSGSASVEVAASGSLTNAGQTTSASVSVEASASGSAANAGQSVSGSAEVEVSASGALANAGQSPSGSASVEVSVSGTLTNAGQSVQGFIGEVPAQVSGAVTNGGQSLSGSLTTEAALSAVVANGGQQISGSAAVEAAASASIENAGQVIASATAVAASLSGSLTNAGQTITGRMVNGAVLVPSRITLSLESTHALSLSLESSHVLELSIE